MAITKKRNPSELARFGELRGRRVLLRLAFVYAEARRTNANKQIRRFSRKVKTNSVYVLQTLQTSLKVYATLGVPRRSWKKFEMLLC